VRSQNPANTLRSWVIRITAVPQSRRMSPRSRMICACTVTSSAVVGWFAMIMRGRHRRAIAAMIRCRLPPENSRGYMVMRAAASGIQTASSIRAASATASRLLTPLWVVSTSAIWSEIRMWGLSDVIGSWKIIVISV